VYIYSPHKHTYLCITIHVAIINHTVHVESITGLKVGAKPESVFPLDPERPKHVCCTVASLNPRSGAVEVVYWEFHTKKELKATLLGIQGLQRQLRRRTARSPAEGGVHSNPQHQEQRQQANEEEEQKESNSRHESEDAPVDEEVSAFGAGAGAGSVNEPERSPTPPRPLLVAKQSAPPPVPKHPLPASSSGAAAPEQPKRDSEVLARRPMPAIPPHPHSKQQQQQQQQPLPRENHQPAQDNRFHDHQRHADVAYDELHAENQQLRKMLRDARHENEHVEDRHERRILRMKHKLNILVSMLAAAELDYTEVARKVPAVLAISTSSSSTEERDESEHKQHGEDGKESKRDSTRTPCPTMVKTQDLMQLSPSSTANDAPSVVGVYDDHSSTYSGKLVLDAKMGVLGITQEHRENIELKARVRILEAMCASLEADYAKLKTKVSPSVVLSAQKARKHTHQQSRAAM
jgi:hypothetical protein